MKKFLLLIVMGVVAGAVFMVSAKTYGETFPSYVPVSGGAWAEVDTSQGLVCFIVPLDFRVDCFGFSGSGNEIANLTNSTVSGTAYSSGSFGYYGRPSSVQCRFNRMGTLEVYAPYQNNYSGTSYQWEPLSVTAILNTNIALIDDTDSDRQNDALLYTISEKLQILVFCSVVLLGVYLILRRVWKA